MELDDRGSGDDDYGLRMTGDEIGGGTPQRSSQTHRFCIIGLVDELWRGVTPRLKNSWKR